jgi:hypothetical protein
MMMEPGREGNPKMCVRWRWFLFSCLSFILFHLCFLCWSFLHIYLDCHKLWIEVEAEQKACRERVAC